MSEKLYTVEQAEMLVERNLLTDKIVKLNEILNTVTVTTYTQITSGI